MLGLAIRNLVCKHDCKGIAKRVVRTGISEILLSSDDGYRNRVSCISNSRFCLCPPIEEWCNRVHYEFSGILTLHRRYAIKLIDHWFAKISHIKDQERKVGFRKEGHKTNQRSSNSMLV